MRSIDIYKETFFERDVGSDQVIYLNILSRYRASLRLWVSSSLHQTMLYMDTAQKAPHAPELRPRQPTLCHVDENAR